jgi:hypothetical protein
MFMDVYGMVGIASNPPKSAQKCVQMVCLWYFPHIFSRFPSYKPPFRSGISGSKSLRRLAWSKPQEGASPGSGTQGDIGGKKLSWRASNHMELWRFNDI